MKRKNFLVGVAGHVDHGKTSLVRTLTGIDTDRLPEEKKRGLSIEPGFANLNASEFSFDFVDIPGHKNYLPNALRSLFGLDLAVLVVAVNDGVMPQTVEHFEVLKALKVKSGLIVLSKSDLADRETIQFVRKKTDHLTKNSFLEGKPIVEFSATQSYGQEELIGNLVKLAKNLNGDCQERVFRFAIDRSFIFQGQGKVVTGLVTSGEVKRGEKLQIYPSEELAIVKKIQRHRKETGVAKEKERAGINLSTKEEIKRGMILGKPGELLSSQMINLELAVFSHASRPLFSREKVYVYHLSTVTMGKVILWQKEYLSPGEQGLAQIRLTSPIVPFFGDSVIIRFLSPQVTAAGGIIVDTNSFKLRKGTLFYFSKLEKYSKREGKELLLPLIRSFTRSLSELSQETGFTVRELEKKVKPLLKKGIVKRVGQELFVSEERFNQALSQFKGALKSLEKEPSLPFCMSKEELYTRVFSDFPPVVYRAVMEEIVKQGYLKFHEGKFWFKNRFLPSKQARIKELILKKLSAGMPLREAELFSFKSFNEKLIYQVLDLLLREGKVVRFKDGAYMEKTSFKKAKEKIVEYLLVEEEITVAEAKELLGWGRRATISFLEQLDRLKITARKENKRNLVSSISAGFDVKQRNEL